MWQFYRQTEKDMVAKEDCKRRDEVIEGAREVVKSEKQENKN